MRVVGDLVDIGLTILAYLENLDTSFVQQHDMIFADIEGREIGPLLMFNAHMMLKQLPAKVARSLIKVQTPGYHSWPIRIQMYESRPPASHAP